ncbi:carbohydrate sulfotransferase 4-like [Porites lutea]|uniref:carbohydrate sulfotransferase 4-like n=1 Tax=Porites lutea TaxID=51062 RepID=UPI003CC5A8D7
MTLRRILRRHLRLTPLRICLIGSSFMCFFFLGIFTLPNKQQIRRANIQDITDINKEMLRTAATRRKLAQHSRTARNNLIIVSHGRSGSSLMGDIFNHNPSVFYMYEPLQSAKRITKGKSSTNESYSSIVEKFLTGVFRCKFDQPEILADIEKYYRKPDHPRISQAIASPPLCPYKLTDSRWDPKLCYPMTSESLESACKDNYNLTVIKVLMDRIPESNIKTVLTSCNSFDVDCKILFLVRDPRAVIPSSRSFGFFNEKGNKDALQNTRLFSYKLCKETEENLDFIRKLPDFLRKRIKLQRYEEVAMDPLKELSGLYDFVGLPVLESVRTWLNETTQLSRSDCNEKDGAQATCTKDNARVAANRWRWKVHPHDISVIEYYCASVMRLVGYRTVDRSYELLANVTIPLFTHDYEAKNWGLH